MKTVRVKVAAGDEMEDARRGVEDVLEMLNRHFRSRGVEFVGAMEGEGDWTIALYWKDFGGLGQEEFEAVYEEFKKEKKPIIHVFFKEPDDGIAEALKAFKEAFEERYGHFYCRFETVDAVKFQLVAQSLSLLPGTAAKEMLKVEGGVVRLGKEMVSKLENLPFAKLNADRMSLLGRIADAEEEIAELEERDAAVPGDEDVQASLRTVRVRCHDLKDELEQYDGFLFETVLFFVGQSAREQDSRVRQARVLFDAGRVREANRMLDLPELIERDRHDAELFVQAREARVRNIQAFTAKAKLVMADTSLRMHRRVDVASKAYTHAVRVAKEIHQGTEEVADILFDHAYLLQAQLRYRAALPLCKEALGIYRQLAAENPSEYGENMAWTQNNLAFLQRQLRYSKAAERNWQGALGTWKELDRAFPGQYVAHAAWTLGNLAVLHTAQRRLEKAAREYGEVLETWRRLAKENPEAHESGLAAALGNVAMFHWVTGQPGDAEREDREALEIWRRLAKVEQETYEAQVATTLLNLANAKWDLDRLEEAEAPYEEALGILRRLAEENPEAYEGNWAAAMDASASLHWVLHRATEESERRYKAALAIRRRLTEENPESCSRTLAATLCNLANLHKQTDRRTQAEAEYREALELDRRLAEKCPEAYESFVALTLCNLAGLCEEAGAIEVALSAAKEGVERYERCEQRTPGRFVEELAEARVMVERLGGKGVSKKCKGFNGGRAENGLVC